MITVTAGILVREGRVLICQRKREGAFPLQWEFPGGKRLGGESLGTCLEREILEELAIRIKPLRLLRRIDYQYPEKRVSLYFFECEFLEGSPWPRGCRELRWIRPFELKSYSFPPADEVILKDLSR